MIRQTITTPAGDTVDVLTDQQVLDELHLTPQQAAQATSLRGKSGGGRLAVLAHLWTHGPVEDPSGRCAHRIAEATGLLAGTVGPMLRVGPVMARCITLDARTKRTYGVRLTAVLERWLPALPDVDDRPVPPADGGGVDVDAVIDDTGARVVDHPAPGEAGSSTPPPPDYDDDRPVVEGRIADAVATALLAQVVEIIATRDAAAPALGRLALDVEALEARLGTQVAYVDGLRKDLRLAGDEIAALRVERDGLRRRLRETEHNLRVATSASARRIVEAEAEAVARVMRETPIGPGTRVAAPPAGVNGNGHHR